MAVTRKAEPGTRDSCAEKPAAHPRAVGARSHSLPTLRRGRTPGQPREGSPVLHPPTPPPQPHTRNSPAACSARGRPARGSQAASRCPGSRPPGPAEAPVTAVSPVQKITLPTPLHPTCGAFLPSGGQEILVCVGVHTHACAYVCSRALLRLSSISVRLSWG